MAMSDRAPSRRSLIRAMAGAATVAAFPAVVRAQAAPAQREALVRALTTSERRIRAVGVMREGRLLYEYHREDLQSDTLHDVRSVTKSVVSLLAGIAIGQRRLPWPDCPMAEVLTEAGDPALEPRVRQLTWGHFLSMSTGFAPFPPTESEDYRHFLEHFHRADGVSQALRRPLSQDPGTRWHYSNLDSQLAGLAVSRAVARAASAGTGEGAAFVPWARQVLLDPLGARDVRWDVNASGIPNMAAGLWLRLRDMLALGQLVAQRGRWQAQPLVDANYLARSTTAVIETHHPLRDRFISYGWLWWLAFTPDGATPAVYAVGYGGQYIYVVPQRHVVIAVASEVGDADHARGSMRTGRVIRDLVLPIAQE